MRPVNFAACRAKNAVTKFDDRRYLKEYTSLCIAMISRLVEKDILLRIIKRNFMKKLFGILAVSMFIFTVCIAANAQNAWLGSYEFDEDGGKTAGGSGIFISHEIEITEIDGKLLAKLQSNGYQTSSDLICTTKTEGNKLLIYFESYGENNMFEPYEQGDLLLTLEKQTVKGQSQILTFWNKFQPSVPQNEKSGKIYFKKTAQTTEKL